MERNDTLVVVGSGILRLKNNLDQFGCRKRRSQCDLSLFQLSVHDVTTALAGYREKRVG